MPRKISNINVNTFEGTRQAFASLVSRPLWYSGIKVNGKIMTPSNASQIKVRFEGRHKNILTVDYMEDLLRAAGYKIIQPVIWQK